MPGYMARYLDLNRNVVRLKIMLGRIGNIQLCLREISSQDKMNSFSSLTIGSYFLGFKEADSSSCLL